MKNYKLREMTRGWFIGDFSPACFKTKAVEVGIKRYAKGDHEGAHFHKVSTEITAIISGHAEMNGVKYGPGDIIVTEPGESADFKALDEVVLAAVKVPGTLNDKFEKEAPGHAEHRDPDGRKRKPLS